jgi:hypothetical protein
MSERARTLQPGASLRAFVVHLLSLRRTRRPDATALAAMIEPSGAIFGFLALRAHPRRWNLPDISLFILAERVPSPA